MQIQYGALFLQFSIYLGAITVKSVYMYIKCMVQWPITDSFSKVHIYAKYDVIVSLYLTFSSNSLKKKEIYHYLHCLFCAFST